MESAAPDRAPALLVVPGLGLRAESWAPTLDALGGGSSATVARLPGYGSPAPRGTDLHPRALAGRLAGGLTHDSRPLLVLGHSAGCQVAAHLAALRPDRVCGLVLVGPTTDPAGATWPRLASRWLGTALHETPRQVPSLVRQYRRTTLRSMARTMDAARTDPIAEVLGRSRVPVLVVRGKHDRICPEDWGASVAAAGGPGSRVVTLPAGAHMVPFTHGPHTADATRAFSGRLAGA